MNGAGTYLSIRPGEDVHLKLLVPYLAAGAIIGRGGEAVEAIKRQTGARLKMSKVNDFYPGTTERVCLITGTIDACLQLYDYIAQKVSERPELSLCSPSSPPLPAPVTTAGTPPTPSTPGSSSSTTTTTTSTTPAAAVPGCCMTSVGGGGGGHLPTGEHHLGYADAGVPYCFYQPPQQQLAYPFGVLCPDRRNQVKLLVPNKTAGIIIGRSGCFIKNIMEKSGTLVQVSQRPTEIKLPERCIVITGDVQGRLIAMSMILSKIAEDPESASCPYFSYSFINEPVASAFPTGSPYASGMVASPMVVDIPTENGHPNQAVILCPTTSSSNSSVSTVLDEMKLGNSASTVANVYQQVMPSSASYCPASTPTFYPVVAAACGSQLLTLPPGQIPADHHHQLTSALGGALPTFPVNTWITSQALPMNEYSIAGGSVTTGVGAPQLPLSLLQPVSSSTSPSHVTPPLVNGFGDVLLPMYATGQPPGSMDDRILNMLQNYGRFMPMLESNGLLCGPANTASNPVMPACLGETNCLLISPADNNLIYGYPPQLFAGQPAFPVMQSTAAAAAAAATAGLQHQLHHYQQQAQQVYDELVPVVSSHLFNVHTNNTITNSIIKSMENGVFEVDPHQQHIHRFYPNGLMTEPFVQPTFLPEGLAATGAVGHTLPSAGLMPVSISTGNSSSSLLNPVRHNAGYSPHPAGSSQSTACSTLSGLAQQVSTGCRASAPTSIPTGSYSLRSRLDEAGGHSFLRLSTPQPIGQEEEASSAPPPSIAMTTSLPAASGCAASVGQGQLQSLPGDPGDDQGLMLIGTPQQVHSALIRLRQTAFPQPLTDVKSGKSTATTTTAGVEVAFPPSLPWRVDTIRDLELSPGLPGDPKPLSLSTTITCTSTTTAAATCNSNGGSGITEPNRVSAVMSDSVA